MLGFFPSKPRNAIRERHVQLAFGRKPERPFQGLKFASQRIWNSDGSLKNAPNRSSPFNTSLASNNRGALIKKRFPHVMLCFAVRGTWHWAGRIWVWLKIKQEGQTAGFGPCFHLPGQAILEFRLFGCHSHMHFLRTPMSLVQRRGYCNPLGHQSGGFVWRHRNSSLFCSLDV